MSAGGAFGGARGYQPKPPDKGVFPLDHFGECKQVAGRPSVLLHMHQRLLQHFVPIDADSIVGCDHQLKEDYMQCLKRYNSQAEPCRSLAKAYLECRMER